MAQLNSVLTPEQQQIWSQMAGQPFSFSPSVYFERDRAVANISIADGNATDARAIRIVPRNVGYKHGDTPNANYRPRQSDNAGYCRRHQAHREERSDNV